MLLPEGDLLRDVYLRGSPAVATVALTFDDGPNGRCTEAVLDDELDTDADDAADANGGDKGEGPDASGEPDDDAPDSRDPDDDAPDSRDDDLDRAA